MRSLRRFVFCDDMVRFLASLVCSPSFLSLWVSLFRLVKQSQIPTVQERRALRRQIKRDLDENQRGLATARQKSTVRGKDIVPKATQEKFCIDIRKKFSVFEEKLKG